MYGQFLNFVALDQATKSTKLLEESDAIKQPLVGGDIFQENKMISKLENDAMFLASLSEKLEESSKEEYFGKLQELLENTDKLFREVDMKPRTCSVVLDTQELTEESAMNIYKRHLTENVTKDYIQPLTEGTLIQDNKEASKLILEASLSAGITSDVDSELFLKYALFENTIAQNIKGILIPEVLEERTQTFLNVQSKEYFDIFEENAGTLLEKIQEDSMEIAAMISPSIFLESVSESNNELKLEDITKYKGASKILNR